MDRCEKLEAIKRGEIRVDIVGDSLLPRGSGYTEIFELMNAVCIGYNKNLNKLNSLRNYINKELREKAS